VLRTGGSEEEEAMHEAGLADQTEA